VADVNMGVMIPMMKRGLPRGLRRQRDDQHALVGALMPTSHNLIIYALAAARCRLPRWIPAARAGAGS
jgi:TRAP-type C4-dicarboxylate transport system permease large subunit